MSTSVDSTQINQLIAEKRYEDAKNILRQSSDPSARAWLDRLEIQFPPPLSRPITAGGTLPYYAAKERGGCLTVWLPFLMIVNPLISLYYLANGSSLTYLLRIPGWVLPLTALLGLFHTVCLFGIWNWKKWGIWGFMGGSSFLCLINLIYLGINGATIGGLIGLGIMWYLLQNRWAYFD